MTKIASLEYSNIFRYSSSAELGAAPIPVARVAGVPVAWVAGVPVARVAGVIVSAPYRRGEALFFI